MELSAPAKVHFVGIGGAGMSAIAKVLIERGFEVSGSDLKPSRASAMLEAIGAKVSIGHDGSLVEGMDAVVVSSAIAPANPEYKRAQELGISVVPRGEALAAILNDARSIVVSGTHGKTTTTSMIATVLRSAGLDPTYLIGAGLNDAGTNARSGGGDLVVAESDESDGSFLLLRPYIAVVTNIEMDHVDHWASIEELRRAFADFVLAGHAGGRSVLPVGEQDLIEAVREQGRAVLTFGADGDVSPAGVVVTPTGMSFTLTAAGTTAEVDLRVPGAHNVENAVSAAAACVAAGVPLDEIASGLGNYRGVERRFQVKGRAGGVTVIDDYAHHPTEVRATLAAARPGPYERVIAVFQPHRYSRTAALADEFGAAFGDADVVVLMDVYGAGEHPVPGVTGASIADAVGVHLPDRPVVYFPHRGDLLDHLQEMVRPGDLVLTLGAGDVTTVGEEFLARLQGHR